MNKSVVGAIVGGVILFVWSYLAWVILPLHGPSLHQIANEEAAIQALQSHLDGKAVYSFPRNPGMSADKSAMDGWTEKVKRGPNGLIVYDPAGVNSMMPSQMLSGLILDILSAWMVVWFLARSIALNASYLARVAYCGMFGVFSSLFTHLMAWNWMGFPIDYTSSMIIDAIVSWLLAGLGIAAIVKSPRLITT
jgi:hypothetical protein